MECYAVWLMYEPTFRRNLPSCSHFGGGEVQQYVGNRHFHNPFYHLYSYTVSKLRTCLY
jgi:hypothetical protein